MSVGIKPLGSRVLIKKLEAEEKTEGGIILTSSAKKKSATDGQRLKESLRMAMKQGDGLILLLDADSGETRYYSRRLMCPVTGLSYSEPAPHNFSFNSPHGACPRCKGIGEVNILDMDKIVPDLSMSIYNGDKIGRAHV